MLNKGTFFKYSDTELGIVEQVARGKALCKLIPSGTVKSIPENVVKRTIIPQELKSSQLGTLKLFEFFEVDPKIEDPFIMQLVSIKHDEYHYIQYFMYESGEVGIDLLKQYDENLLNADPDLVQLKKLDNIPVWLTEHATMFS